MRVWGVVASVVAAVVVVGSGTAYATGNVPERLMPTALVNDAWQDKHCGENNITLKCPNPGQSEVSALSAGNGGVMVAYGDSYSAGEGLPEGVWREGTCSIISGPVPCWRAQSGFQNGTDGDGPYGACHQSALAYPNVIARSLDLTIDNRTCSGAKIQDYWNQSGDSEPKKDPQRLAQYPENTELITIGFGGNNALFSPIIMGCLATSRSVQDFLAGSIFTGPGIAARLYIESQLAEIKEAAGDKWNDRDCAPTVAEVEAQMTRWLPDDHSNATSPLGMFEDVRKNAPSDARVIVIGYPRVFPTNPTVACNMGSGEDVMGPAEQVAINNFVHTMNETLKNQASRAGIDFVNIENLWVPSGVPAGQPDQNLGDGLEDPLADHGLCQNEEKTRWINRLQINNEWTVNKKFMTSFHPRRAAHNEAAELMVDCYEDATKCDNYLERKFDYKSIAFSRAGCLSRDDFAGGVPALEESWDNIEVRTQVADVTQDGEKEALVQVDCPASTSSWPSMGFILDIREDDRPKVLVEIKDDLYFRSSASIVPGDGTVTMSGVTVGPNDSLCCASHWGLVRYRWDGTQFQRETLDEARTDHPIMYEAFIDGEHYGYLRGANRSTVYLAEDVPPEVTGFCDRFAIKPPQCGPILPPNGEVVRAVPVAADAVVLSTDYETIDTIRTPYSQSGEAVLEGVEALYRFVIVGGQMTELEQFFYYD